MHSISSSQSVPQFCRRFHFGSLLPPWLCSSPSSGESAAPSLLHQHLLHSLVSSEHSINLFSMDHRSQRQGPGGQEAWANLTLIVEAEQCSDRAQGRDASCRSSLTSHHPQLRLPKQRESKALTHSGLPHSVAKWTSARILRPLPPKQHQVTERHRHSLTTGGGSDRRPFHLYMYLPHTLRSSS